MKRHKINVGAFNMGFGKQAASRNLPGVAPFAITARLPPGREDDTRVSVALQRIVT
jgi:hypothetical protein